MTIQMFLGMLLVFASISSLITEAIKMLINDRVQYASNIIVLIVSIIVGAVGLYIYYILNDIVISNKEIVYIGLMGIATWLSAMGFYDKFCQTIIQISNINQTNK